MDLKMDFIEKTGKNVEEALNDALAELKTTADKVNVEVIEEAKNGIFGLFAKKFLVCLPKKPKSGLL